MDNWIRGVIKVPSEWLIRPVNCLIMPLNGLISPIPTDKALSHLGIIAKGNPLS